MDTSSILTFRSTATPAGRVHATVSPVLELVYAGFLVHKWGRASSGGSVAPTWLPRLARDAADVLDSVVEVTRTSAGAKVPSNIEAVLLAARYGYIRDADPERFLADFRSLIGRMMTDGRSYGEEDGPMVAEVRDRFVALAAEGAAEAWVTAHRQLWQALATPWEHEARPAAESAVAAFWQAFETSGHVLGALPPHHFVRFESGAAMIERAEQEGRVVVVPLGLASGGGLLFDVDGTLHVGFGLRTEQLHEHMSERMTDLAQRMKAFADPTRAGLLALIGRFGNLSGLHLTVGDLAAQIGVSQPTVSGHLRLLREAGLVQLDKRGNKAFYRVDEAALRGLLREFEEAVLEGPADARPSAPSA